MDYSMFWRIVQQNWCNITLGVLLIIAVIASSTHGH